MGKNATFHNYVKSEHGYSRKYPEHVFSVIGLSLCCHSHDHKMRQITNCDGSVAICDCRNFWRFKTQLLRLISIVTEGIAPKFRKHIHIKIGPVQEGFLCTTIISFITDMHTHKQINQWNNTKMGKNTTFHIHVKNEPGYSPKYPEHVFSVIGLSLCRHGLDHKLRQITNCDGKDSWIVAICDCRNLWRFKTQILR